MSDDVDEAFRQELVEVLGGMSGRYLAEGVDIPFGGACPVQGDGTLDGHPVYYRSRGTRWSFDVWEKDAPLTDCLPEGDPIFTYVEIKYTWPDGGWVEADETVANIGKAVELFRSGKRGNIVIDMLGGKEGL